MGASANRAVPFAGKRALWGFPKTSVQSEHFASASVPADQGLWQTVTLQGPFGLGSQLQAAGVTVGTSVARVGQARSSIKEHKSTPRVTSTPKTGITPACRMDYGTELMAC